MTAAEYAAARAALGLTQAQLAQATDCTVTAISRRENGVNSITPWAEHQIRELLRFEGPPPRDTETQRQTAQGDKDMYDTESYNYPMVVVRQRASGKWECEAFRTASDAARWMRGDLGECEFDTLCSALADSVRDFDIMTVTEAMERVAADFWSPELRKEIAIWCDSTAAE